MPPRYYWKFTDAAGDNEVVFPHYNAEYEERQPLFRPSMPLSGGDYEYDLMGVGALVKANAEVDLRFWVLGEAYGPDDATVDVDEQSDFISTTCHSNGRGKLWAAGGSGERWRWARLKDMAAIHVQVNNRTHRPMFMTFVCLSDWTVEDFS